jgi:drug/metabolite transporter (DMT)-like permease
LLHLYGGQLLLPKKNANETMGPISFVGIKFLIASLVLAPLVLFEARKQSLPLRNRDFALAVLIGLCLFVGSILQQIGLLTTSVSNAGFLTALYVIFVPFIVWLLKGNRPRVIVLVACAVSIIGAWLLANNGLAQHWAIGDVLVVLADVAWALGIALVPIFLSRRNLPFLLSFIQYAITAVLGVSGGIIYEPVTAHGLLLALPSILYAGLLSGGIAYTIQIIGQRHTPPAEAALILSLESVFAAISGAILLQERLTMLAVVGCALIFLGVFLVEVGPVVFRIVKSAFFESVNK